MLKTLREAWDIPDLRRKILYMLMMLFVYRLGTFIPVPYINTSELQNLVNDGGIFGLFDILSGGNFSNFTIFAMGITPYINASIIMNLLTFAIPYLENISKEGDEGRKKIARYTEYLTIVLALVQSLGISLTNGNFLLNRDPFTIFTVVLVTTAGTTLLMYIGELITENGIGNGISLIIFISIISRIPDTIMTAYNYLTIGTVDIISVILLLIGMVIAVYGVVAVTEAQRRIPVQYAKRVVGRKQYGGQSTYIPLRINMAGVIPIIFASSITLFPATIANFMPNSGFQQWVSNHFAWGSPISTTIYVILIIAFTYFYTRVTFNPYDVADNLKKQGGYIAGIRPGKPTAEYLERIVNRLTVFGAIFLAIVAVIPIFIGHFMGGVNLQFGGTSLLIVVGVAIDTVKQLESEMTLRQHAGFLK